MDILEVLADAAQELASIEPQHQKDIQSRAFNSRNRVEVSEDSTRDSLLIVKSETKRRQGKTVWRSVATAAKQRQGHAVVNRFAQHANYFFFNLLRHFDRPKCV